MARFIAEHVAPRFDSGGVLDVGSYDVNGTHRDLWPDGWDYVGVDIRPGPGVDRVVPEPGIWNLRRRFEVVFSSAALEHVRSPWRLASTMGRHLKPGGLLYLCAPFEWPIHRHPADYWRFLPDGLEELLRIARTQHVASGLSERFCWTVGRRPEPKEASP